MNYEIDRSHSKIEKIYDYYHKIDKEVSIFQIQISSIKKDISDLRRNFDEIAESHSKEIAHLTKEFKMIRKRHELEDIEKERKKNFWTFFFANWRFFLVLIGGLFSIAVGGYEMATKLHDSVPQKKDHVEIRARHHQ